MTKKTGTKFIYFGLFLIVCSLLLTCFNVSEDLNAKAVSESVVCHFSQIASAKREASNCDAFALSGTVGASSEKDVPDYIICPDMEMPVEVINGQEYIGILEIPVLDLSLPVMSQWDYDKLKSAPCRYEGSAYTNNLIIVAHNYSSHFGPLKNLSLQDPVKFTDAAGNVFEYEVADFEVISPSDVEGMKSGDWDLTLFTCTPGGAKRFTVRCVLTPPTA